MKKQKNALYAISLFFIVLTLTHFSGCGGHEDPVSNTAEGGNNLAVQVPRYGSLTVTTEPAGANIYLDGQLKGTSPITLTNISVEAHTLTVTKDVYLDKEQDVTIEENKTTTVSVILMPNSPF